MYIKINLLGNTKGYEEKFSGHKTPEYTIPQSTYVQNFLAILFAVAVAATFILTCVKS